MLFKIDRQHALQRFFLTSYFAFVHLNHVRFHLLLQLQQPTQMPSMARELAPS